MTIERQSAHTPGPWFAGPTPRYLGGGQYKDGASRQSDPITIRSPAHTEEIATVWTYLLPTEANARLIAAAPDLFSIADRLVKSMWLAGISPVKDSNDPVEALLFDAHAAIAKAEGH